MEPTSQASRPGTLTASSTPRPEEEPGKGHEGFRTWLPIRSAAVSSKDGLFPAFLGEDGAWLVLGVWVVC